MTWMGRSAACRTLTVNFRKTSGLSSCGEPVVPVRDELIFGLCLISVRLAGAWELFEVPTEELARNVCRNGWETLARYDGGEVVLTAR